jgi:hypothetical protein
VNNLSQAYCTDANIRYRCSMSFVVICHNHHQLSQLEEVGLHQSEMDSKKLKGISIAYISLQCPSSECNEQMVAWKVMREDRDCNEIAITVHIRLYPYSITSNHEIITSKS